MLSRRELLGSAAGASAGVLLTSGLAESLQDESAALAAAESISVAFLVDADVTLIDFIGPAEVFYNANFTGVAGFSTFTVGPSREPVRSEEGIRIIPDYSIDNAPQAHIIVIPAQPKRSTDARKIAWLKRQAPAADIMMSVCTGAFLFAQTGMLDGVRVTTHHEFYDRFAKRFPAAELVRNVRYVDTGKIITAGGLTSGIDAAFHVVRRCYGLQPAQRTADYMEYQGRAWLEGETAPAIPKGQSI